MALHIARVNCPFLVLAIQPMQIPLIAYNTHMQQCLPRWQDRRKGQQFLLVRSWFKYLLILWATTTLEMEQLFVRYN
jgi:hypothetical protein